MGPIEKIEKVGVEAGTYRNIGLHVINRWILYDSWYNNVIDLYWLLWVC